MQCTGETGGTPEQTGYKGKRTGFTGVIRRMENKNGKLILQISNTSISDRDILLYLSEENLTEVKLHTGQKISASGIPGEFDHAHNRGEFDLKDHYDLKGIDFPVYEGVITGTGTLYDHLKDGLYRIRNNTAAIYEKYFNPEEYGVIKALVLADRSSLDNGIKQQYQNAGISHIHALSGLHIATVGFIVFGILRKLRLPVFISVIISTCLITLYCIMVGMPVSAMRALIMFLLSMGAMLLGRTPDLRTSAAAAAVIMLMMRPDSLCDSSFLLSFSAVMGIGLVYPSLRFIVITAIGRRRIQKLNHSKVWAVRMMMGILRTLLVSSAIQLTMLPFILWFYYQFPTYGILVNIAAVPLAGFLLIFAVAVGQNKTVGRRYMAGLIITPFIGWALGTFLGAVVGDILPVMITEALGIAIYAMFLAIIIPPARENKKQNPAHFPRASGGEEKHFFPRKHIPRKIATAIMISGMMIK